ncbi:MAG: hypothetical protein OEZ43_12340 [Gammaproteobacteria bacterium]|nr:hypothetical protein [Gammaproteobacteria bacterium]
MNKPKAYIGIDKDINGGMTPIGKVIRDAWVFGLIPETQTCEGWTQQAVEALMHKVNAEWDKYGCMVRCLPTELFEKHQRIHGDAVKKANQAGWNGNVETDDEE